MTDHVEFRSLVLVPGQGSGAALVLGEPLSLWGGLDPDSGEIIDRRHSASGANVAGAVLLMPIGRGSSSASSILLEAVRTGKAPAAIITVEPDPILALGAAVAREMYATAPPVVVLSPADYNRIRSGQQVSVFDDGRIVVSPPSSAQP